MMKCGYCNMRLSRCLCLGQISKKQPELPKPLPGQKVLNTSSLEQSRYVFWMRKIRDCVEKDVYLDGSPRKPEDSRKS